MTSTPTVLKPAGFVSDTEGQLYAAPTTCKAVRVDDFTLSNRDGSDATVYVRVVPVGGTPGVEHEVLPLKTIPAGEVVLVDGMWLAPGESIRAEAGTASAIVARIGGRVFT